MRWLRSSKRLWRSLASKEQGGTIHNAGLIWLIDLCNCLNFSYRLAYIIVTKRLNTRFFTRSPQGQMANPAPGTVIDDVVTSSIRYDFYVVSVYLFGRPLRVWFLILNFISDKPKCSRRNSCPHPLQHHRGLHGTSLWTSTEVGLQASSSLLQLAREYWIAKIRITLRIRPRLGKTHHETISNPNKYLL